MIAHLKGKVVRKGLDGVVLDVNGVGYLVEVPLSTLDQLPHAGEVASLHVHTHVREDRIRLYGFEDIDGLRLFERLLTVSGVGPKIALAALGQFPAAELHRAIVTGDAKRLSGVPGVGKRTAERIIVDLGPALQKVELVDWAGRNGAAGPAGGGGARADLHQALQYLGYRDKEIRHAVDSLDLEMEGSVPLEELLKRALKMLQ